MDLSDPGERVACADRLGAVLRGRRLVHGPRVLAATVGELATFSRHGGGPSLVVATIRGAGEVPADDAAEVVWLPHREFRSVSEELRQEDSRVRHLPPDVAAVVEAFDPDRSALWVGTPFVTSDEPILGRQVVGGRPAAWLALEDKIVAEDVWVAASVEHAPSAVVPVDVDAVTAAAATLDRGAGVVLAGDNREGFHGGGNLVRWVTDDREREEAVAFFGSRCDRVRVQPFLDGVPCSIHGFVAEDGTAALRPVEIAMLRRITAEGRPEFVYGGLSSYWDPPEADREAMRAAARRVGEHLRVRAGYRGFFGIDGVLTAEGFRPTELNTRLSAGVVTELGALEPSGLATLLQLHATSYPETSVGADDLESIVPALDAHRSGRVTGMWEGDLDARLLPGGEDSYPLRHDGTAFEQAEDGDTFAVALSATGLFGYIRTCTALRPGERLAPLNRALMEFLDGRYGTGFGVLDVAPDVR